MQLPYHRQGSDSPRKLSPYSAEIKVKKNLSSDININFV